jgi:hypothetical protein
MVYDLYVYTLCFDNTFATDSAVNYCSFTKLTLHYIQALQYHAPCISGKPGNVTA